MCVLYVSSIFTISQRVDIPMAVVQGFPSTASALNPWRWKALAKPSSRREPLDQSGKKWRNQEGTMEDFYEDRNRSCDFTDIFLKTVSLFSNLDWGPLSFLPGLNVLERGASLWSAVWGHGEPSSLGRVSTSIWSIFIRRLIVVLTVYIRFIT